MVEMICPECHYVGKAARKKRGSTKVEIGCWLVFPLGLPYTFWRMLSKFPVCRHCGNDVLIPVNNPVGKKLMALRDADPFAPPPHAPAAPPPTPVEAPPAEIPATKPSSLPPPHRDPNVW